MDQTAAITDSSLPAHEAQAYGPGLYAWLAPLAAVGVGLLAVTLSPPEYVRWALIGLAAAALPMLPTSMVLSLIRGPRPVFFIWQTAVAASLMRMLASAIAAGVVVFMTDAPLLPFAIVFLLVAGVGLASEKLIVLGTARVAVQRKETV